MGPTPQMPLTRSWAGDAMRSLTDPFRPLPSLVTVSYVETHSERLGYTAAQETLLNIEFSEASTRSRQPLRRHLDSAFE